MITGRTRIFALLGDPVRHSLSPLMQNAGFRAAGLDAKYLAIPCVATDLPGVIRSLVRGGGGGNITVPHKAVAAGVGVADPRVASLGVANLFWSEGGAVHVGNTDVDGMLALLDLVGAPIGGWLVLGTGGSARAAVGAAAARGAAVAVRSRSPERRRAFESWLVEQGVATADPNACQVVINATPLGLDGDDTLPIDLGPLPVVSHLVDLTYRSHEDTPLVAHARERGVIAADGREMLLIQGVAAWKHWFPGVSAPVEVMRAALAGRMA